MLGRRRGGEVEKEREETEGGREMEMAGREAEGGTQIRGGKRAEDVERDKEGKERGVMEIRRQRMR